MVILFNTNESYFYNWRLEFILCNAQILFLSEDKRGILLLNSLSYPGSKFQLMCVSDAFEQVHIKNTWPLKILTLVPKDPCLNFSHTHTPLYSFPRGFCEFFEIKVTIKPVHSLTIPPSHAQAYREKQNRKANR